MAISDQITALQNDKTAIATAITNKGGTVNQGDGFDDFAIDINTIPTGVTPSGNIALTATTAIQTGINISSYATASVAPTPTEDIITNPTIYGHIVQPSSGKYLSSVTVNAMPTGVLGEVYATKTISNHIATISPNIGIGSPGYNNMYAKSGDSITVTASELTSGSLIVAAGTSQISGIDCVNYATITINPTPTETKTVTTNGTVTPTSGKFLSSVVVSIPIYDGSVS